MSVMIFVVSLQKVAFELIRTAEPSRPGAYSRSCAADEMKSAIINVSYAASRFPDTNFETDSFDGNRIEVQYDGIAHNGLIRCS